MTFNSTGNQQTSRHCRISQPRSLSLGDVALLHRSVRCDNSKKVRKRTSTSIKQLPVFILMVSISHSEVQGSPGNTSERLEGPKT